MAELTDSSKLPQLVMDCPWTEAEVLECFLSL